MADVNIRIVTKLVGKGLKQFRQSLKDLDGKVISGLKTSVAGIGVAAAAGFGVAAKESLDFAGQANEAMRDFAAQTGAAGDELEEYKETALDLFAAGVGENIADVADAMAEVSKQTGLAGDDLEKSTRKAVLFAKRMDKDVGEVSQAAAALMQEFGLTSDEAFDFIGKGLQDGLDNSGDFLETITEYSNLFGQAETDAGQFFSILETGLAGGVLGTDKIADAFKEFSIRAVDQSDATVEAIEALDLQYGEFEQSLQSGEITVQQAFDGILDRLKDIEDPLERNRIGVALFGTQWEDLGEEVVLAVDSGKTALEDMEGASSSITETTKTLGEQWDTAFRQLLVGAEPAAQTLMPLLAEGIKSVGDFFVAAKPVLDEFATNLSVTVGPAMALITDAALRIGEVFGFANEETTGLDLALKGLESILDVIVTALEAVAIAAQGLTFVIEKIDEALTLSAQLRDQVGTIAGTVGSNIGSNINALGGLGELVGFQHGTPPGGVTIPPGFPNDSFMVGVSSGENLQVTPAGQGGDTSATDDAIATRLAGIIAMTGQKLLNEGFQDFLDDQWNELVG